jgi:hypothetical protein
MQYREGVIANLRFELPYHPLDLGEKVEILFSKPILNRAY